MEKEIKDIKVVISFYESIMDIFSSHLKGQENLYCNIDENNNLLITSSGFIIAYYPTKNWERIYVAYKSEEE
jgi:hypothetical protein